MRSLNTFPSPADSHEYGGRRRVRAVVLLLLLHLGHACALQPEKHFSQYVHDAWYADKGFFGGPVHAIAQSEDGYLWIGTDRGLLRFDGHRLVPVPHPLQGGPALGAVRGLINDGFGNLWIRVDGAHLIRYRAGTFEDMLQQEQIPLLNVSATALDNQGQLLVAGLGDQLFRFSQGHFHSLADAKELPGTVLALCEGRDGTLWIGTRDAGLYRWTSHGLQRVAGMLGQAKINALLPTQNGGAWVGTDNGLFSIDSSGLRSAPLRTAFRSLPVMTLVRDEDGNVWAGNTEGLLRVTSSLTATFEPGVGPVTALFPDKDGSLWYGDPRGLNRLRDGMFRPWSPAEGLPTSEIGAVSADSVGRIWFAPLTGGLYWLRAGELNPVRIAGLPTDVVYSISSGGGEVWLGRQRGGVTRLTESNGGWVAKSFTMANGLPQNTVTSIFRSRNGSVWGATPNAGIFRISLGKVHSFASSGPLAEAAVNSIAEDKRGVLWFATSNGLVSFNDGTWSRVAVQANAQSSYVQTVYPDRQGTLWLAMSAGLARLSGERLIAANDLPEPFQEHVLGITEDALGNIWLSTTDHVLRANRDRLATGSLQEDDYQTFGVADGIPQSGGVPRDRSLTTDDGNHIWMALRGGLAEADPKYLLRRTTPNAVRMDAVSLDGINVPQSQLANLAPGKHSISFHFSSTLLSSIPETHFRYQLEGVDKQWSPATDLQDVLYKDLGPGLYRFRVIASGPEGLWNGPERVTTFRIEPAYWQTSWFLITCSLLVGCAAVLIYRLRVLHLTQQLNARFEIRLSERTRIAQELHDTLLQGFQALMMRFDVASHKVISSPAEAKHILDDALILSDKALDESRRAIQGIRKTACTDDLKQIMTGFMQELSRELQLLGGPLPTTSVVVEGQPRPLNPWISEEICRIAHEALRNSFAHARAQRIDAEILYSSSALLVRLRDDGIGIDAELLRAGGKSGHWGLVGMRERTSSIYGHLQILSQPGVGVLVQLEVPAYAAFSRPNRRLFERKRRIGPRQQAEGVVVAEVAERD